MSKLNIVTLSRETKIANLEEIRKHLSEKRDNISKQIEDLDKKIEVMRSKNS